MIREDLTCPVTHINTLRTWLPEPGSYHLGFRVLLPGPIFQCAHCRHSKAYTRLKNRLRRKKQTNKRILRHSSFNLTLEKVQRYFQKPGKHLKWNLAENGQRLKAVNYLLKKLHLRFPTRFWIRLLSESCCIQLCDRYMFILMVKFRCNSLVSAYVILLSSHFVAYVLS